MNNREIVDYILSNKLNEDEVIKEIEHYKNKISIMYLWNDGFHLYNDNGEISIIHFADEENSNCYYTYEIVSQKQAIKEIDNNEKKKRKYKDLKMNLKD